MNLLPLEVPKHVGDSGRKNSDPPIGERFLWKQARARGILPQLWQCEVKSSTFRETERGGSVRLEPT